MFPVGLLGTRSRPLQRLIIVYNIHIPYCVWTLAALSELFRDPERLLWGLTPGPDYCRAVSRVMVEAKVPTKHFTEMMEPYLPMQPHAFPAY